MAFFENLYRTEVYGGPDQDVKIYDRPLQEVLYNLFLDENRLLWLKKYKLYSNGLQKRNIVDKVVARICGTEPSLLYSVFEPHQQVRSEKFSFTPDTKTDFLRSLQSTQVLVDIACGTGRADKELAVSYPKTIFYAIDFEMGSPKIKRQQSTLPNLHFLAGDWQRLPLPNGIASRIISSFGIGRYWKGDIETIQEINRIAQNGATFRMNNREKDSKRLHQFGEILSQYNWKVLVDEDDQVLIGWKSLHH